VRRGRGRIIGDGVVKLADRKCDDGRQGATV
jgi:hypothetical protein